MTFEEWLVENMLTPDCDAVDAARNAWETAWYEGLAEGYKEGIKDSKFCKWCLEELAQEQE